MLHERNHHLWYGRVSNVFNGSNIMVANGVFGFKVRLSGIAIPHDSNLQQKAKEYVMSAVLGRWVGLELGQQQWDQYSRQVSKPWYGEGFKKDLCQELLDAELAVAVDNCIPASAKMYHPRESFT